MNLSEDKILATTEKDDLSTDLNDEVGSGISNTRENSGSILDLSEYEELFQYAESISRIGEDDFDINQFYESVFDYYGKYRVDKTYEALKKLRGIDGRYDMCGDMLCRLAIELVPLKRLIQKYENEESKEARTIILSEINKHLEELFKRYDFLFWTGHDEKRMDINTMQEVTGRSIISFQLGNWDVSAYIMNDIAYFLQKIRFEERFNNGIGIIDLERLKEDTLKYGAKGANLRIIRDIFDQITNFSYILYDSFYIPTFNTIPTSIYDKWSRLDDITEDLKPYYDKTKGKKIMIRSSAVYSEDREDSTGAGIYESIEFDGNKSFDEFKKVVEQVYRSVNSERAIAYRREKLIKEEKMGIIIQNLVEDMAADGENFNCIREKGYVNTVVKGVPRLMDIILRSGIRPVIDKETLLKICINPGEREPIFYYQIDIKKFDDLNIIESLAMFSFLLEKFYGKPIQLEFITSEFYNEGYSSVKRHAILQTRFLPMNYSEVKEVQFPDKEILFEGRALGIGDIKLDVLPNWENNSEKEGIVIFKSSKFSSLNNGSIQEYNLPKSGVVIVLGESEEDSGHIETLCAERGLLLVFNKHYKPVLPGNITSGLDEDLRCYTEDLLGHKRLHVVMDGLVSKVYPE